VNYTNRSVSLWIEAGKVRLEYITLGLGKLSAICFKQTSETSTHYFLETKLLIKMREA